MSPSWPNFQHILTEAQYFMGQTQGLEKATFLCDETLPACVCPESGDQWRYASCLLSCDRFLLTMNCSAQGKGTTESHMKPIQQQEAQDLVTRCATVLQQRFGAKRVIPFGSVVVDGAWHPGSDLALSVEGIVPEQFFRAWAALREICLLG